MLRGAGYRQPIMYQTAAAAHVLAVVSLTCNSAYGASGNCCRKTASSSEASIGIFSLDDVLRKICWHEGGMPVIGSSLVLSWKIDHDGVMRLSAEA